MQRTNAMRISAEAARRLFPGDDPVGQRLVQDGTDWSGREAEPIIIHYESVDPIHPHPDGSGYFRCRLSSSSFDDFGGGLAQGMFADQTLPDGRVVSNIRNILTFPGLGFAAGSF